MSLQGDWQQVAVNMKDESVRLNNRQTRFINDLDISQSGTTYSHFEPHDLLLTSLLISLLYILHPATNPCVSGTIYFSDSSSRHTREYNIYEFLEAGPHGTLFSYNMLTREIKVSLIQLIQLIQLQLADCQLADSCWTPYTVDNTHPLARS